MPVWSYLISPAPGEAKYPQLGPRLATAILRLIPLKTFTIMSAYFLSVDENTQAWEEVDNNKKDKLLLRYLLK